MPISYQPLARKYRPGTFQDLVGQELTAVALGNAIRLGREPHAVVFSGVRGVGKTTSARLYAKALNCDVGSSAEPCDKCESCSAIDLGNHEDVIEIDGASNTSVDNVRSLRETISYATQRSRFKVYIIDEVHMLSQSAFNALLKTLEEPPAHVIFVFATTELQKIPQTILSRCQVYFLQKLTQPVIFDRLVHILTLEKLDFEQEAVAAIAREGHGSMRDALTLLDHVIAIGDGNVKMTALSKIVSHVSVTPFLDLLDALVSKDQFRIVELIASLSQNGVDIDVVAEQVASIARHAFMVRDVAVDGLQLKALGFDDQEAARLRTIALGTAPLDLNRLFRTLVKCRQDLDGSPLDRFILENYCLEWCFDPGVLQFSKASVPVEAVSNSRAGALSRPVISINPKVAEAPPPTRNQQPLPPVVTSTADKEVTKASPRFPSTWRELIEIWMKQKPLQARKLEEVQVALYSPQKIELVIPEGSYISSSLLRPEEQRRMKEAFTELFCFSGVLAFKTKPLATETKIETIDNLPESLASVKEREAIDRRAQIEALAVNHPLTKEAVSILNGTIERVTVLDA